MMFLYLLSIFMDIWHCQVSCIQSGDVVSLSRVTLDASTCPSCTSLISPLSTAAFQFCRSTEPCMFEIVFGYPAANKETNRQTRLARLNATPCIVQLN